MLRAVQTDGDSNDSKHLLQETPGEGTETLALSR